MVIKDMGGKVISIETGKERCRRVISKGMEDMERDEEKIKKSKR